VKDNSRARRDEIRALAGSTYALVKLGRVDEAVRRLSMAFALLQQSGIYPAPETAPGSEVHSTLRAQADLEAATGQLTNAIVTYKLLLEKLMASKPKPESNLADAADLSQIYGALASLCHKTHDEQAATGWDARRMQLWKGWEGRLPGNPFVAKQLPALKLH
jgi:hypothetical protein